MKKFAPGFQHIFLIPWIPPPSSERSGTVNLAGSRVTTDTTVLVRGLVPPRRKRQDVISEEYIRLHSSASEVLRRIEEGEYQNHIPLLALIETACVVSRLTNDPESASLSVSFVSSHAKLYDTADLLERSIEIGIASKASGFDVIFMACADITGSLLITDDRKMYERARESGIDTTLLREWETG